MAADLSNPRHILITGASSGIGEALALAYAAPGARLVLGGRNPQRLADVAARCEAAGAKVETASTDVQDMAGMAEWIDAVDGASPLDLVIANAGVSGGSGGIGGEDDAQVREIFAVNLAGVLNTVLPARAAMVRRGFGQIAIVSSLAGFRGLPSAPAYSASKAAVRAFGEGLRGELAGSGVSVCVICPGFVVSRITDKNDYPMPFLMPAEKAAGIIRHGLARNRARIAFPWPMHAMMWLLATLPPALTDPIFRRLPKKD